MDIEKLKKALDNEENEKIMNLTSKKINEMNLKILKELVLNKKTTIEYLKKLKGYKYVDEINEIKYGSFIKWIPIEDPNYLPLNRSGIITDLKITSKGVLIVCKNFINRYFSFYFDESLVFQKLSSQEEILLSALDYLNNSKK